MSVEIGDSKSEYTLLIPFGEDQCVLVSGSLSAADLTTSLWRSSPGTLDKNGTAWPGANSGATVLRNRR